MNSTFSRVQMLGGFLGCLALTACSADSLTQHDGVNADEQALAGTYTLVAVGSNPLPADLGPTPPRPCDEIMDSGTLELKTDNSVLTFYLNTSEHPLCGKTNGLPTISGNSGKWTYVNGALTLSGEGGEVAIMAAKVSQTGQIVLDMTGWAPEFVLHFTR